MSGSTRRVSGLSLHENSFTLMEKISLFHFRKSLAALSFDEAIELLNSFGDIARGISDAVAQEGKTDLAFENLDFRVIMQAAAIKARQDSALVIEFYTITKPRGLKRYLLWKKTRQEVVKRLVFKQNP